MRKATKLLKVAYFFFFLLTLFKLGCLCWRDELFFIILSKSIYKFGYRFIGQHIGYRLLNINHYRIGQNVHIGASLLVGHKQAQSF